MNFGEVSTNRGRYSEEASSCFINVFVLSHLQLHMKIDDVEISWALGATLDLLTKMT